MKQILDFYILIAFNKRLIQKSMEPEKLSTQYKVIQIQQQGRKQQPKFTEVSQNYLIGQLDKPTTRGQLLALQRGEQKEKKQGEGQIYCYQDTGLKDRSISASNNFLTSFLYPYNQHGDILLVPDDIWLMISLYLSKYIDNNAEKLRSQFVHHQGQKQLTIIEYAGSLEQSLKMEKQWDFFFTEIIKQIRKHTVEGVVDALKCDFTTTTKVHELISTAVIMSSFKKYFIFRRGIMCCGIQNVYFDGTREDWLKVQSKLMNLERYDVDGQLKKYINAVGKIIEEFINTYDGKPDRNWWNTIMTSEERRVGSGSQKETTVEGWILHFYGIYHKVQIDSIPKTAVSVPIKLYNDFTKIEKKLQLIADWVSTSKVSECLYKPDIGMVIVERSRNKVQ